MNTEQINRFRILDLSTGWENVTAKDAAIQMKELRATAVDVLKYEKANHVIYATKEYKGSDILIRRIALIPCNDTEFEVYAGRQTENHILLAVHSKEVFK
ncbi:hypothetical protein I6N96_08845 [Enterococcus sp. BWM-S5]|uniref:DUF4258 domain-containing protein n=1 Tax=Enterococcus larvae TaxID=2794352 RepID=A0ABS4CJU6_9ENTE|nr:hypothetical protein [Enterococcus larvae]MBP1046391.1 hypothetical protein [Enterococcus larvae]